MKQVRKVSGVPVVRDGSRLEELLDLCLDSGYTAVIGPVRHVAIYEPGGVAPMGRLVAIYRIEEVQVSNESDRVSVSRPSRV